MTLFLDKFTSKIIVKKEIPEKSHTVYKVVITSKFW